VLDCQRFDLARPQYDRKIRTYSRIHFHKVPGFEQADLEIELYEVLWIACRTYNPDKGAAFNSYFWSLVHRRFADLIKFAFRKSRMSNIHTVSLDVEAVRTAIEETLSDASAEEEVLARISVQDRINEGRKVAA